MKKVLVVVTNIYKYENTKKTTDLWLSEAVHFVDVIKIYSGYNIPLTGE